MKWGLLAGFAILQGLDLLTTLQGTPAMERNPLARWAWTNYGPLTLWAAKVGCIVVTFGVSWLYWRVEGLRAFRQVWLWTLCALTLLTGLVVANNIVVLWAWRLL